MVTIALAGTISVAVGQTRVDSLSVTRPDSAGTTDDVGWVSLRSNPPGAEVYQDSRLLGKTPLVKVPTKEGDRVFRLFYPNASQWGAITKADSVAVRRRMEAISVVSLNGSAETGARNEYTPTTVSNPDLFLATPDRGNSKVWYGYAAGTTMMISGVLSAYIKNRSDRDFDAYVASGDPALLNSTQRLDRLAGVALLVTEMSLGVLIYLLLVD